MSDVTMTYDALQNAASNVETLHGRFSDLMKGMTDVESSLDGEWQGEARAEFDKAMEKLKPTMEVFLELLEKYDVELKKEVSSMQQKDSAGAKNISGSLSLT